MKRLDGTEPAESGLPQAGSPVSESFAGSASGSGSPSEAGGAVTEQPTGRSSSALWRRATELAGRLNRLHAELVELTAQVIAADAWGGQGGVRSPEHWLALQVGLSQATAAHIVSIARRGPGLPRVTALLAEGQLSLDQAAVIARHVPSSYEASVTELAPRLTATQLSRVLSRYPFEDPVTPPSEKDQAADAADAAGDQTTDAAGDQAAGAASGDGSVAGDAGAPAGLLSGPHGFGCVDELSESARRAAAPGEVSIWWDRKRLYFRGHLPADTGALVENALREAKDALFTAGNQRATLADALVEMANRSLAAVECASRAERYRVYVHLDTDGAWLNGRGAIPAHVAERYACDADQLPVWMAQGKPVSVGRTQRGIPTRTRRLVEDRDRGCAYPGCSATRFVEIHHIEHWEDGGGTDYDNLICLCPFHHAGHHAGQFTIAQADPGGLVPFDFINTGGHQIRAYPPGPDTATPSAGAPPTTGPATTPGHGTTPSAGDRDDPALTDPATDEAYRGPLGERLDMGWVMFRRKQPPDSNDSHDAA